MPVTYNGVGTHYYGHSNSERRVAACHSCRRNVNLESYDTRLWFVIIYIPIIPLGRKRIVDQCPVCRRHYAVSADEWETKKQLNVSGAMDEYLKNPTPENAMGAHQQMMNFHQMKEAAEFRREISGKFSQNGKLQAYLGESLTVAGQSQDARAYYERALELRSDLPEARVGVARDYIRQGRLDEARALLDFLEKPGAAQLYTLGPLETLAYAYMNAGKRAEALELFGCILSELPQIGQMPAFRKSVRTCEKALGKKPSTLPKRKFSWKGLFGSGKQRQTGGGGGLRLTWQSLVVVAAIAALIFGGILIANFYRGGHRSLYIVNGFPKPAKVEVRGVGSVEVGGHALEMTLPEGKHHATISGPVSEELDFEVRTDFWGRVGDNTLWLLNVGGAALLTEEHLTYRKMNPPPGTLKTHFGKEFERIDGVTHPFSVLPETVHLQSGGEQTLVDLNIFRKPPEQMMGYLQTQGRKAELTDMAEWRVKLNPEDEQALILFASLADRKHVENVLRAGLQRRPVAIQWHRIYQNLNHGKQWDAWVAVEYDAMLKAEPGNSALLYLRGRVAATRAEAAQWYEKARQADPRNSYPIFALGYERASVADWAGAKALFAQAVELNPAQSQFSASLFSSRLALQEYDALEKELRAAIAKKPLDYMAYMRLVDVLEYQGLSIAAENIVKAYQKEEQKAKVPAAASVAQTIFQQYLYSAGLFDKLAKATEHDRTAEGRLNLFFALVEQGKLEEAARIHPLDEPKAEDPWHFIAMSAAWLLAQDKEKANEWLRRGVQLLEKDGGSETLAAELFKKDAVISPEKIDAVDLAWQQKAILLTALGVMHADQRKQLFGAADRFNVDRSYPFHLLKRITTRTH